MTDFQLNEIKKYTAIWSGSLFAFGSLHSTENLKIPPQERILLALEAAANFDVSTGPPFNIFSI